MKKRILSLLVVMTLILSCAVPVAATEAPDSGTNIQEGTPVTASAVSEDTQVQAVYDAYLAMAAAYDSGDFDAMKAAREEYWALQEDFTEEQTAEWERIVKDVIGEERCSDVTVDAGWLVDFYDDAYSKFKAEKNAHNAYYYVKIYEYMDWIDIDKYLPDASALYAEAKALAPTSENVIKVYETYEDMMFWFVNEGLNGFFEESCEEFKALIDVFNEFTEDELTQLAGLLGVADAEAAYDKILNDWIVVNVAMELDARADAFEENYDVDAAKSYVEYYESIIDSDMFTEEELELIIYRNHFDSVYEEALYAIENAIETVSDDPVVQAMYENYVMLERALAYKDVDAMKAPHEFLNTTELSDSQEAEWEAVVEKHIGANEFVGTAFTASYIIEVDAKYDAYLADKNAKTAYDFIKQADYKDDMDVDLESYFPGITADYDDAKANYMPSENVIKVYEAYVALGESLDALAIGIYDEDFIKACEDFEAVLDIFNGLTDEEQVDLAAMIEVADVEAMYGAVLTDWINASLALELGELCDAYLADYENVEVATAFVERYEEIYNDTEMLTAEDKKVILTSFEDAYNDAKAFLEEQNNVPSDDQTTENGDESTTEQDTPSDDEAVTEGPSEDQSTTDEEETTVEPDSGNGTSQTGDDFNVAPFAALMVIAAVAALAVRKRKVQ